MKKICSAFGLGCGLALALLSTACNGDDAGTSATGDPFAVYPFEDEWREVVNTSFPLDTVKTITIGRREFSDNFASRGDIEVLFDQDTETIIVEMRKYAMQGDQAEAEEAFSKLSLWAYSSSGNPDQPSQMDEADNCVEGWQDGCKIYVYYDGLSQPVRSGADFRVHLPRGYRNLLNVETEDNTSEDAYKQRGDITIKDLCGSATLRMENGVAKVRMCPELEEGPTCSADQIANCEAMNWDANCGCTDFGQLKITSLDPYAGNITVDFPAGLWANVSMENTVAGSECLASFDNCNDGSCVLDQSAENLAKGKAEYNYPGEPATPGVGYAFNLEANGCETVFYVDEPDDYVLGEMESPKSEQRGNLSVCTGCLADL